MMIRLSGVSKIFYAKKSPISAVSDVTFCFHKGSFVLLTGKNGSGKSTLMMLMSGILSPTSGRVYFDGMDISRMPERFMNVIRRERIGMIFQERFLISGATAWENLILPLIPTAMSAKDIRKQGKRLLDRFGLAGIEKIKCGILSGGEKQRLMIARALINDPDVIFADEPATHLDEEILDVLGSEIAQWKAAGKTVVIATHQQGIFGNINPDLVLRLSKGRLTEGLL